MSRTYNRRNAIAKRKRNEAIQDAAQTALMVSGAIISTVLVLAFAVGLGYVIAQGVA